MNLGNNCCKQTCWPGPPSLQYLDYFASFYVIPSIHMVHQTCQPVISSYLLLSNLFSMLPPWCFLCVIFTGFVPQLGHRTFIFCIRPFSAPLFSARPVFRTVSISAINY